MSQTICKTDCVTAENGGESLDLGRWMGRREAFALISGRCSAADAETLRRIREEKLFRSLNCTWAEFCMHHLHVSRRTADRLIRNLEEFGPTYFHIAQLTYIGPKHYRQIAAAITPQGVQVDSEVIPLLPEHSRNISAAVSELLQRIEPTEAKESVTAFELALKRCHEIAESIEDLYTDLSEAQKVKLAEAVDVIRNAAVRVGIE